MRPGMRLKNMTTRRKPLPYAAIGLLDTAIMENATALHALKPLIERKTDEVERAIRIAQAIGAIYRSTDALKEARRIEPESLDIARGDQ